MYLSEIAEAIANFDHSRSDPSAAEEYKKLLDLLSRKLNLQKQEFGSGHDRELHELAMRFAEALSSKLRRAEEKYNWRGAWKNPDWQSDLAKQIRRHVDKGDPLDVAAYCAFAWHHGWSLGLDGNLYDRPPIPGRGRIVPALKGDEPQPDDAARKREKR